MRKKRDAFLMNVELISRTQRLLLWKGKFCFLCRLELKRIDMSALSKSTAKSGRSFMSGAAKRSGSSQPAARDSARNEHIVSFSLEELKSRQSKTDWARVDATTEAELRQMDLDDPDLQGFEDIDWSKATLVLPEPKAAISIRLDPDVLAFFKADGAGYQSRINAVLRSYMKAVKKG
jgi:uncharacterized protein (DUF4415 family)